MEGHRGVLNFKLSESVDGLSSGVHLLQNDRRRIYRSEIELSNSHLEKISNSTLLGTISVYLSIYIYIQCSSTSYPVKTGKEYQIFRQLISERKTS